MGEHDGDAAHGARERLPDPHVCQNKVDLKGLQVITHNLAWATASA
jgi:hypothetical protein